MVVVIHEVFSLKTKQMYFLVVQFHNFAIREFSFGLVKEWRIYYLGYAVYLMSEVLLWFQSTCFIMFISVMGRVDIIV